MENKEEKTLKKKLCMITSPAEEYENDILKYAIRLKADKTILVDENESCTDLLKSFGMITDVAPIFRNDVGLVADSTLKLISEAKKEHDEVHVVLLPSDPVTTVGMYIAACMEKVKVHTIISKFQAEHLPLPVFPFVNINKGEILILTKIIENGEISKKRLLKVMEKEGNYDFLGSKPDSKKCSVRRHVQRKLDKLKKIGLVCKRRSSRHFIWSSTSFGRLVIDHNIVQKNL